MADAKRVLVAEDHPRTRQAWTELIASWGFEVEAAEDGQRAVELIKSLESYILLLDLKLPIKDGLGVLGEIRQRGLPITTIVISGEGDIPEAVQAIKLGAYDYLRKPVDPPRLRQTLNQPERTYRRERGEPAPAAAPDGRGPAGIHHRAIAGDAPGDGAG